jgi:hypothetical protein
VKWRPSVPSRPARASSVADPIDEKRDVASFLDENPLEDRHEICGKDIESRRQPEESCAIEEIDAFFVAENDELFFDRVARAKRDFRRAETVALDEVGHQMRVARLLGPLQCDCVANERVFESLGDTPKP